METEMPEVLVAPRKHKKSRTGCKNCKIRRVKCDEKHPICGNCSKYYSNAVACNYDDGKKKSGDSDRSKPTGSYKHIVIRPATQDAEILRLPKEPAIAGLELDPFSSHPSSKVHNAQSVMHHYFRNFRTRSIPVVFGFVHGSFSSKWWKMASDDELMFHATLQLSAHDLDKLKGAHGNSRTTAQLGTECVRLLRTRIAEAPGCIGDSTIAAVLSLLVVEFERGNMNAVRTHLDGLKQMVRLRGGISNIRKENILLANVVYGATTVVMAESQFPPDPEELKIELELNIDVCPPPMLTDFEKYGVSTIYAQVFRRFQYNIWVIDTPTFNSNVYICTTGVWMQHLLHLPVPPEEDGLLTSSVSDAMRWACSLATFIPFVNEYPNPQLFMNSMIHKLRSASAQLIQVTPLNNALLPFLFSLGAVWFVNELVNIVEAQKIDTWDAFRSSIARILWANDYCNKPFKQLWDEIESRRISLKLEY